MDIDIIINNLKDMLVQRGENIDEFEEHEDELPRDEFYKKIIELQSDKTTILFAINTPNKKILIEELKLYMTSPIDFIEKYHRRLNIIIVFDNSNISVPNKKIIATFDKILQKMGGALQFFNIKHLLYNPTKHVLVPKHTKLTQDEITEFMDKYLIKNKTQLPFILHTDPIAKWLGLKQGDIVKIDRYNENSGLYYYYRLCL